MESKNTSLLPSDRVLVTGARGMVGSALVRALSSRGFKNLLTPNRGELDLTKQEDVARYLERERPDILLVAAAKVGGIHANSTYPADFIYENLMVAANAIHQSFKAGVRRLLFLGSSCIYPKYAPQPMVEECLLTGPLEPTNEPYAIAKIAGLKLAQSYRRQHGVVYHSAMPTNLYGPGDNYHPTNSHVLPGILRRIHEAKLNGEREVVIWGSGTPRREFLYVDDLAEACLHLLALNDPPDWVNIGSGSDVTIRELAESISEVVGYKGQLRFDPQKPDGTPRKLMASTLMAKLGWRPRIELKTGLSSTYQNYLESHEAGNLRAC